MDFPKVELHVHLDGAINHSTLWELLQKKNLPLPKSGSYQDFLDSIIVKTPDTLLSFLKGFGIFLPAIIGDLEAIERMSYEFCEYQSKEGVIYAEPRYCPHLLIPHILDEPQIDFLGQKNSWTSDSSHKITTESVVEAVNKGLKRGQEDFGIVTRTILSCIRGKPEWSEEILNLCIRFRDSGVVGIDIAGDEAGEGTIKEEDQEGRMLDKEDIAVFEKAAELGIHRTVHAGEAGPAKMVLKALDILKAERIGHGYRVLENEDAYKYCLENNVHFECCPTSSILTGSINLDKTPVHPIVRFAKDRASISVNTDDPTITNTKLNDEYELLKSWGLTEKQLKQSNLHAMERSFAEPEVKKMILEKLRSAYGSE